MFRGSNLPPSKPFIGWNYRSERVARDAQNKPLAAVNSIQVLSKPAPIVAKPTR